MNKYQVRFKCVYPESEEALQVDCIVNATTDKEARFKTYQSTKTKLGTPYIKVISNYSSELLGQEKDQQKNWSGYIDKLDFEKVPLNKEAYRIFCVVVCIRLNNKVYEIRHKVGAANETKATAQVYAKIKRVMNISTSLWFYKNTIVKEIVNYKVRDLLNLDFEFIKIREYRTFTL